MSPLFVSPYEKKSIGKYWIQYFLREFSILHREKALDPLLTNIFFSIRVDIFDRHMYDIRRRYKGHGVDMNNNTVIYFLGYRYYTRIY